MLSLTVVIYFVLATWIKNSLKTNRKSSIVNYKITYWVIILCNSKVFFSNVELHMANKSVKNMYAYVTLLNFLVLGRVGAE